MASADAGRIEHAARWLVRQHLARRRSRPMPPSFAPRHLTQAYETQQAFVALKARACGPVVGHKIALTTPQMRALVGLDSPIAGCLLSRQVVRGPATVRESSYGRLLVEFEIAFQMESDLAADRAPFAPGDVAAAVRAVMPAFELADDRGADYTTLPARGLELAADNAWNEGAVLGAPIDDWRGIDFAAVRGVAYMNGVAVGEGRGADSMGHPLAALAWIANHLAGRGQALRAGDFVLSGSLVTSKFPRAGDQLRFEAGALGAVELRVT
jgi:2-keto-4-pentenoate hydratase